MPVPTTERRCVPRLLRLTCLTLAFAILAACTQLTGRITEEPRADAALSTRIKARLLEEPELGASAITVRSDQGRVTLLGFVASRRDRERAGQLAGQIRGVTKLVNQLEVKE